MILVVQHQHYLFPARSPSPSGDPRVENHFPQRKSLVRSLWFNIKVPLPRAQPFPFRGPRGENPFLKRILIRSLTCQTNKTQWLLVILVVQHQSTSSPRAALPLQGTEGRASGTQCCKRVKG